MPDGFRHILGAAKFFLWLVLFLFLAWIAFLLGSPAGAAASVKALAIILIIAIGLFSSKAYRWFFRR